MSPRKLIYYEYGLGFIICLLLYLHLNYSILLFFLLLLFPDITMLGYFVNSKIGSIIYNIGHSLVIPFTLLSLAYFFELTHLLMVVIIWVAHIFLDRAVGFGLKYEQTFKETHLQKIE